MKTRTRTSYEGLINVVKMKGFKKFRLAENMTVRKKLNKRM
jgi:hypothetical protein